MPILIERDAFEHVPQIAVPETDAEFLGNVDLVAELLGVSYEDRERAITFLEAVQPPQTEEEFIRRESLVNRALELARPFATPETERTFIAPSIFLLRRLCNFDYDLAEEGVEVAELGMSNAARLSEITGVATDQAPVWSDGLGHDDGKGALDPELNSKSKRGEEWTLADIEYMKDHSPWGYIMTVAAGLSKRIAELKYSNHAKQLSPPYGEEIELDRPQRRERDSVAGADDLLAGLTRSNRLNKYVPEASRWARAYTSLLWRFGDYDYLSSTNNPDNIARELLQVGQEFVSVRYRLEQEPSGLVVVHKLGALSLAST